jgi:hypothetical protein
VHNRSKFQARSWARRRSTLYGVGKRGELLFHGVELSRIDDAGAARLLHGALELRLSQE